MSNFAHVNGDLRIITGRILLPAWGAWSGDLQLADDAEITGRVVVTIGNLVLVGAAFREGAFAGSRSLRVVGGAGGWRTTVARRFYSDANGVKLSTVAGDAASEVGETVASVPTTLLGSFFARALAPASRCLSLLVGRDGWYVDVAGITRLTTRPTVPVTSAFTVESFWPDKGMVVIATEDPLAWQPGAVFSSATVPEPRTVASSSYVLDGGGRLRVEALLDD